MKLKLNQSIPRNYGGGGGWGDKLTDISGQWAGFPSPPSCRCAYVNRLLSAVIRLTCHLPEFVTRLINRLCPKWTLFVYLFAAALSHALSHALSQRVRNWKRTIRHVVSPSCIRFSGKTIAYRYIISFLLSIIFVLRWRFFCRLATVRK